MVERNQSASEHLTERERTLNVAIVATRIRMSGDSTLAHASACVTLRIPRASDEWRSLYRRRSAVEREFGNLKHNFGLAFLRVRGIERVRLHAT
jgi:Transposase DDE domain